ncbi:MAG: hypothetical protein HON70_17250, partial [Lentisphaerae bacterium]|nr:hypothetical protein [Lentisphaerota bacterium]
MHNLTVTSLVAVGLCLTVHGRIPLAIRGSGTVHLRPTTETLSVTIEKRDLNIYENAETLTVTLMAPDRSVIKHVVLPDDGSEGKTGISSDIQSTTLTAPVAMTGIYQVRVSQGNGDQVWGFSTDCPTYAIETPIFLNDPSLAGDVYFLPPDKAFTIAAEAVHEGGIQPLPLKDGSGQLLYTFELKELVTPMEYAVPETASRTPGPWHIHISRQDVRFKIKGVTFWSNRSDSLFDLSLSKSLLTPYATELDLVAGQTKKVKLDLWNGKSTAAPFDVLPADSTTLHCQIVAPELPVSIPAKSSQVVEIECSLLPNASVLSGSRHGIALTARRVGTPNASGSATITVRVGPPRADTQLDLPIVLRPYEHESVQFGYCPEYEPNAVFFDRRNRPYIRMRRGNKDRTTGIQTLEKGKWVERSFLAALEAAFPGHVGTRRATGWHGTKVFFDAENHLYTLLTIQDADLKYRYLLLFSRDGGKTFDATELPLLTRGVIDIEHATGHGEAAGPPPVVLYESTKPHPARFAAFHDLKILFPEKTDDGIVLGDPILVTDTC